MISIQTMLLILLLQFFLLKSHIFKDVFVFLRNRLIKPWFRIGEKVIYEKNVYEVIFIFDKGIFYNYYLCITDSPALARRTHCTTVPQYKLRKKTKMEKALE
jgi:hypothetical protein